MVFEAIVVDVLNRFLGAYVENLNRSQLKIGIWGGDVVLENLVLQQNALEELNIPVRIVYGHLGKLVLKIPWKNLYGASVEATVERLFLIVNPTAEIKYDAEKEEKQQLTSKQAELQRIEEAKKQEAQKDEQKVDDSFVEKLVTQIIKNVQLKISDIHVRYEDSITNPSSPFSLGFTLHNLSVHTTDETWKQTVIQEAVSKIFKILTLEGLALYWNTTTVIYAHMEKDQIIQRMQNEIATKVSKPVDYLYVLGPINSTAKLKLNPKPEFDIPKFSIPKCILSLHMEQLSISITKSQYQDMIKLAESMERMSKGAPYRKYRPYLKQYKGHYKEWWKFAYTCILEEDVRRRRKNWDWNHMSMHRSICRDYATAYQTKLTNKGKVPNDLVHVINKCEKHLDLFNLVVIRHRIEVEVERLGKAQEEANKSRGWFSSWWGNSTPKDEETSESTAIMKQFEAAMTPDEKAKLFRAIDYQENSAPLHLPVEFVALECHFQLDTLSVTVTDMARQVLRAMVEHVQLAVLQRPSASGLKVDVVMQEFSVLGVKQNQLTPKLVSSHTITPGVNLLNVSFEMNPLSNDCGQRIHLSARPLEIIYDAQTIIEVVNVFKVPSDVSNFSQLQAVAGNKLSDLKEKSVLGMQHTVSLHTYIDVHIDIASSHIIVPNGGIYTKSEDCLVVNLGAISVKSEPRSQEALNVHKMFKDGLCDEEILKQVLEQTYDKFLLELTEMQVLIAHKTEDWQSIITANSVSRMHLLQPTTLKIQIQKCLIVDDPRLSKIKVQGQLEKIAINASEDRLLTLLEVAVSMPLPESEPVAQLKPAESKGSNLSLFKYLDPSEKKKRQAERKLKSEEEEHAVQLTDLDAVFVMNELIINICRQPEDDTGDFDKLLTFTLQMLEVKVIQKTFTMEALVRLGAVGLMHYRPGFPAIDMISTPSPTSLNDLSGDVYLFTVSYVNVDKKSPDFRSHYGCVEQLIKLEFTTLRILLHLEGLQQILVIANEYGQRISNVKGQKDRIASAGAPLETIMEDEEMPVLKVKTTVAKSSKRKTVETIQLKVSAIVGEVDLEFANDIRPLAIASLHDMQAGLLLKNSYTQVDCSIHELKVVDLNPETIHKEIIKVISGDVLNVRIVLYNLDEFPNVSDTNMSVDAELNCIRIVFLNWFVSSMLEFMNNFQAAQQALIDASNVAADAAKMNVQSAYENSTKIALRVKLKAPIVVVPENSKSENALLVDLGFISVSNKFFYLEAPEEKDREVSVEEMSLELEDMQVGCVHLRDEHKARSAALLEPISFKLAIKRSLSSWFHMLPALDVSGRMKTITITVTHSDFKMIMKVLNENLSEGQKREPEPQVKTTAPRISKNKITPKTSSYKVAVKVEEPKPVETPRTTVKFAFAMDSLVINLKTSAQNVDSHGKHRNNLNDVSLLLRQKNDPSETHLQDVGLARFCMTLLSFKGRMISDGSMHCALLLVDCTLDDMRPARGSKITRYLERRPEAGSSTDLSGTEIVPTEKIRSMLDVTYTLKHSDTFIDVRVFSFNLILAVDFLLKVADFFTSGMAADTPDVKETETKEAKETNIKASGSYTAVGKKRISQASVPPQTEPKKSMMTINLKVEQPEIILVESLEHKDGEALIMNIEVLFKLRSTEDRQVMEGSVTALQLYRRAAPTMSGLVGIRGYVLEPCNFSLAAAQPAGCGMHADLAVSDIKINVSPATINLLSRVMSTVTKSEESSEQTNDAVIVYENLWDKKPFTMNSFWFLKTEIGEDAIAVEEAEMSPRRSITPVTDEICLLSCPCLLLTIEMAMGSEAIPVIALKSTLKAQVKDWSSQLNLESSCSMQISYYNISKALWEPLLEPVEVLQDNQYKHIPWELKLEVQMNPDDNTPNTSSSRLVLQAEEGLLTPEDLVSVSGSSRAPGTTVTVSSSEPLELTLTCTAMDVLQQLGNSFSAAMDVSSESMQTEKSKLAIDTSQIMSGKFEGAPYVLHNCTGLTARVLLRDVGDFSVYKNVHSTPGKQANDYREVVLESSASVPLQLKHGGRNLMTLSDKIAQLKLHVKMIELEEEVVLPVERAVKRYYPLRRDKASGNESRGLLSEVIMNEGAIHIYLRSVVQVRNKLSVEVNVFYMTASGNEVRSLGTVAPDDVLRLPLQAIYTPTCEIFFSVEGFTVSVSPFVWRDLQQEIQISKLLLCESKDRQSDEKFYMRAIGTMEQVYLEDSERYTLPSACFEIVLRPAVIMQNCLPVEMVVSQLGQMRTQTFAPGEMFHLPHLAPHKATVVVMLPAYLEKCWVCTNTLPDLETEFSVWSLASHDSPARMLLELGMHSAESGGSQMLELYCPFWMLNKTGLTLAYRKSRKYDKETESPRKSFDDTANVLYHPHNYTGPILFSFRAKNFFGKKKASIRVEFGDWSDKFSLDIAGSSGLVICKNEGRTYQVAVTNQLTFNSLTKMVIFTPYFLLINNAPFDIECQELSRPGDPWIKVEGNSSKALWPRSEREEKLMLLRVAGSQDHAAPFIYTEEHNTTLKLNNQYGGIHVETQLSEWGTYVQLRQYREGHAPALIVNCTDQNITLYEKDNINIRKLPPMHHMLFTWDNPAGPRILIFEAHKKKEIENDLRSDGIGEFLLGADVRVYWVSFLDGMQRVILFTRDVLLAHGAHSAGELGGAHMQCYLSIQGLGLSLVNNTVMQEILYISISNSGIIWEQCKPGAKRYKKLTPEKTTLLEDAYQRYLAECLVAKSSVPGIVVLDNKMEVNFETMRLTKPNARLLRRTLEPGLWFSLGMTAHRRELHAKLHRLQIDQQLPMPMFPVILAPVPPPRSVSTEQVMKPFAEVSIVERLMEHTAVKQYKYFRVLIQEFHVKVDMILINALMEMFPQKSFTEAEALAAFALDLEKAAQPMEAVAAQGVASDQKHFYDNLHLSPLKVHLSFSMAGATQLPTFLGTILQGIGVTLTDMNDVIFKLGYYEKNYEFMSQRELVTQSTYHYTGQAIKQLYVLVLGLDVIGNPYGLVVGLKQGVEDLFYEPFQGAIQGPGEFAEGLYIGVRSLVGHAVGGAAGAVSRIAGAMGSGLAALSLDEEYQRRRRDRQHTPATLHEGLARSGKGLVMGVVDGVTGVFTKPVAGAREQGVEGFFKGLGRGAVGLVARPTAGVVDFASGSLDAVKRATDMSEETVRYRPPRYVRADGVIRPYSRRNAEGYKLLSDFDKGKYSSTDKYVTHVWVVANREVVLCTDKRILYLEKNNVFGGWQMAWSYLWQEIPETPIAVEKGLFIPVAKKKVLGMFGNSANGKLVIIHDEQQKRYLATQCERLMRETTR